jgi:hypothetical protein
MTDVQSAADWKGEVWKEVKPNFEYGNPIKVYISNYGRVKTDSRISTSRILKGSKLEGYTAFHFRYFKSRTNQETEKLAHLKAAAKAAKIAWREAVKTRIIEKRKADETEIKLHHDFIIKEKKYKKELKADEKRRVIHVTYLAHRLVAEYFTDKPSSAHQIVIHKDHDKLNNHVDNVQWATIEQASAHQQNSPAVIAEKKTRKGKRINGSKAHKLTPSKVSIIKKRLSEGVSITRLADQFKVTSTQMKRIQTGENWGDIEAAK